MQQILIFLLMAGLWSCHKEEMKPEPEPPMSVIEIKWASTLNLGEGVVGSDLQQFYNGEFISFGDLDDPATIFGFDAISGEKNWTYTEEGWDNQNIDYNYRVDNILSGVTSNRVFGFDLLEKNIIWELNLRDLNIFRGNGSQYRNFLYLSVDENFRDENQAALLVEIDFYTGNYKYILKKVKDSLGIKHISPPAFSETSEGTIIYYNEFPDYDEPPQRGDQSIVAYNITKDEEVWRNESFITEWGTNGLQPPVIYNDRVITGGDYSMYGFDIETGEQKWRTKIPGKDKFASYTTTNHLLVDGRVYANETGHGLMCLDAQS